MLSVNVPSMPDCCDTASDTGPGTTDNNTNINIYSRHRRSGERASLMRESTPIAMVTATRRKLGALARGRADRRCPLHHRQSHRGLGNISTSDPLLVTIDTIVSTNTAPS